MRPTRTPEPDRERSRSPSTNRPSSNRADSAPVHPLVRLQETHGNQAVGHFAAQSRLPPPAPPTDEAAATDATRVTEGGTPPATETTQTTESGAPPTAEAERVVEEVPAPTIETERVVEAVATPTPEGEGDVEAIAASTTGGATVEDGVEPAAAGETEATEAGGTASEAGGEGAQAPAGDGAEAPAEAAATAVEADAEAMEEPQAGAAAGGPPAGGAAGPGATAGVGGAGAAEAGGGPELLMPEPPGGLSDAERARVESVQTAASSTAQAAANLPPGGEHVSEARGAVTEPEEETQARAENSLVSALDERPEPSPEIEELCDRIEEVIRSKRPPDEESLVDAEPEQMAEEAGGELDESVRGDAERVQGEYDQLDQPPTGTPQQTGGEVPPQPDMPATPGIDAQAAVPDGVSEEHVDLSADVAASEQRMEDAGMTTEPAQLVQTGPIAEAREAQGEFEAAAEQAPAEVLAEQQTALSEAQADMAALESAALQALTGSRQETTNRMGSQQQNMVESEEQTRARISREAQETFESAQRRVNDLLEPLPRVAMERWERGVAVLSTQFKQSLKRVEDWLKERYEGWGGALLEFVEDVVGLPGWVTEEYDRAEQTFSDGVCALIREISTEVNGVIAACEAIIQEARAHIDGLFSDLPEGLETWAAEQRAQFNERLDGLHQQAMQTRDDFNRQLTQRAAGAVQEVREEVHALRQEARGMLGRVVDAVNAFLDDPVRAIINGLLSLVGIPPASFWALVNRMSQVISDIADDPKGFANNLLTALGQGFQQFFSRIGTHLLDGLLDWLFSGLGSVGVELPSDMSLKSIITFFLQLMGLTWDRIREVLAKHIGEENVALLEKAYEIISTLIELGPEGVFEMIKEQLNPQTILDMVLDAAIDYVTEALIKNVTARIVMLFNPVGAIAQAVEAIYRVLKWVFENAARIFKLVETVVNGAAKLVAGDTSGMAKAIEQALAGLIPPVIDFLAGYAGIGDLPEKIAEVIKRFQDWVMGIVDKVVGFIAKQAKRLLKAVGLGGEEEDDMSVSENELEKSFADEDGDPHELTVSLSGTQPDITVASKYESGVRYQISDRRAKANDKKNPKPLSPEQEAALNKASEIYGELVRKANQYIKADEKSKPSIRGEILGLLTELAKHMVEGDAWADDEIPPTEVSFSGSGGKKKVVADPLTRRPGPTAVGSTAQDVLPEWWTVIPQPNTKWKRVHLLASRLHGSGHEPGNLVPGQQITNSAMEKAEMDAYKLIAAGETLKYVAEVTGTHPGDFFPSGIHVTVTKSSGEEVFNKPIPTTQPPSASVGPELTPAQRAVLNQIDDLLNVGQSPSRADIAKARNLKSGSGISTHITAIRKRLKQTSRSQWPQEFVDAHITLIMLDEYDKARLL